VTADRAAETSERLFTRVASVPHHGDDSPHPGNRQRAAAAPRDAVLLRGGGLDAVDRQSVDRTAAERAARR